MKTSLDPDVKHLLYELYNHQFMRMLDRHELKPMIYLQDNGLATRNEYTGQWRLTDKGLELCESLFPLQKQHLAWVQRNEAQPYRFLEVFCSHCGCGFGPGNSGYSHCEDHTGKRGHL